MDVNQIDENIEYNILVEEIVGKPNEFNTIYFESDEEAYQFFKSNIKYNLIVENIDKLRVIRALAFKTGDILIEEPTDENISEEMRDLLKNYRNAGAANKSNITGLLYDHPGAPGLIAAYVNFLPSLGSARNRGESCTQIFPNNIFCDFLWFGGQKLYVFATPNGYLDFPPYFANKAESVI